MLETVGDMKIIKTVRNERTGFDDLCGRRYITDEFYCKYDGAELKDIG